MLIRARRGWWSPTPVACVRGEPSASGPSLKEVCRLRAAADLFEHLF
jgi:hypothetical protein